MLRINTFNKNKRENKKNNGDICKKQILVRGLFQTYNFMTAETT